MFVFGKVEDPPIEVVRAVEDIVRNQVIQMVSMPGCMRWPSGHRLILTPISRAQASQRSGRAGGPDALVPQSSWLLWSHNGLWIGGITFERLALGLQVVVQQPGYAAMHARSKD